MIQSLLRLLLGSAPKKVLESEKELRFTRSRQASLFFVISAICFMLGLGVLGAMFSMWGPGDVDFRKFAWMSIIPVIPGLLALRVAIQCLRHACIILSPLGVEVFPFFKPESNLRIIYWQEISVCEVYDDKLILHTNEDKTAGVVVSLKPLAKQQICLLQKAITSRTSSK